MLASAHVWQKSAIAGVFLALVGFIYIALVSSQTQTPPGKQRFVPGRLLVKFNLRMEPSHARQIIAALGARDANEIPGAGGHIVELLKSNHL